MIIMYSLHSMKLVDTEKFNKIHLHIEFYVKLCSVMATILDFQSTTKIEIW